MSDSRAAANQEQGTKNQEQPRSGFNFQKTPALQTAGVFYGRSTANKEQRTKNSRAATPLLQLQLFTSTTAAGGDPAVFT
jgi:hypothetical protein